MTNLEAWAKDFGESELEALISVIRHHWRLDEQFKRGELPKPDDWNLPEILKGVVESAWLPCDDPDLELELTDAKGNA